MKQWVGLLARLSWPASSGSSPAALKLPRPGRQRARRPRLPAAARRPSSRPWVTPLPAIEIVVGVADPARAAHPRVAAVVRRCSSWRSSSASPRRGPAASRSTAAASAAAVCPPTPQRQYPVDIARDVGLLLLSLCLVVWPRTRLALDNLLFPVPRKAPTMANKTRRTVEVLSALQALCDRAAAQGADARTALIVGAVVVAVAAHRRRHASASRANKRHDRPGGELERYAGQPHGHLRRRGRRERRRRTTIKLYEDFQCPICSEFEAATGDKSPTAIADGKVKVDYHMVAFLDRASTTDYSSRRSTPRWSC